MYPRIRNGPPSSPLLLGLVLATCAGACGQLTLGQGTQNDPTPSGTILAQGPFTGVNGRAVTGNVAVYQQSGTDCTFVVRLQNLSAPSDASLQVIPVVNGGASVSPTSYVLRSPSGNENYIFNAPSPCSVSFAQIELSNPVVQPASAQNYGIANLTPL